VVFKVGVFCYFCKFLVVWLGFSLFWWVLLVGGGFGVGVVFGVLGLFCCVRVV